MKWIISLITLSFFIILSCNNKEEKISFSKDNLPVEQFVVTTDKDTVLQTPGGALLKIPAGSLTNKKGNTVTLEIKEAYSIEQIIKAGLFTQSNGQPLSSGGMIYINASAGQEVVFNQQIQVAIPADFLQENMQLYKGEEQANGAINWINPDTLPVNRQLTNIDKGKALFQQNCSSCHQLGIQSTGPDLAHFMKRFPIEKEGDDKYYYHDIQVYLKTNQLPKRDSVSIADHFGDATYLPDTSLSKNYLNDTFRLYKCNIHNLIHTYGTIFDMNAKEYFSIFQYIQNESDKLNLPLPSHAFLKDCVDSCVAYNDKTAELKRLKNLTQKQREELIKDNGDMTEVRPDSTWANTGNSSFTGTLAMRDFDEKVSPENFDATYYQFSITSFGWYNIDILIQNLNNNVVESELFVRIVGEYQERINVFIIIPSLKIYGEGGPADDPDKYAFFYKTGKIPLPQNAKAYILAVTEQNEKIAFALKEFTTNTRQEFSIQLENSTKQKFETVLKSLDSGRLHIKIDESKNADSIRSKDKEIRNIDQELKKAEYLKPKNCNCDCNTEGNSIINNQ